MAKPFVAKPALASTNVINLDNAAFLFVPPAPSSTIIKSDVVKSAPISVAPSISKAPMSTLPAVDIVDNLLSGILPANFEAAIAVSYTHLTLPTNC